MKREIKFRAWDMSRLEMNTKYIEQYVQIIQSVPDGTFEFTEYDFETDHYFDLGSRFILMQYTGLKDKNGKEIYEGDIIESKDYHEDDNGRRVISNANSYMKKTVIEWRTALYQGFCFPEMCEVIGNIYENPNLLT